MLLFYEMKIITAISFRDLINLEKSKQFTQFLILGPFYDRYLFMTVLWPFYDRY